MVNISSEIAAVAVIFLVAGAILTWSFYRAKPYGQLGILPWLQSLVLIAPWLIFFGSICGGNLSQSSGNSLFTGCCHHYLYLFGQPFTLTENQSDN